MFYNPSVSASPVVMFSFVDPGFESMDSFRTHLDAYLTLFTKLPQLRFYYIATRDTSFERANRLFREMFQRLWNPDSPFGLLQYFHTRRLWDDKQYGKLSNGDIEFLNQAQTIPGTLESKSCIRSGVRERLRETSSVRNLGSIEGRGRRL